MDYKSYFAGSAIFHPSKFHVVVDFNIKFNYKERNVCIYSWKVNFINVNNYLRVQKSSIHIYIRSDVLGIKRKAFISTLQLWTISFKLKLMLKNLELKDMLYM